MNPWISHVKKYALDNNLSYKDAMKQAKSTYQKVGGSKQSGYVRKMVAMKNLDITKVRKPSKNLKKMAELTKPKQIKVKKIKVVKKQEKIKPIEKENKQKQDKKIKLITDELDKLQEQYKSLKLNNKKKEATISKKKFNELNKKLQEITGYKFNDLNKKKSTKGIDIFNQIAEDEFLKKLSEKKPFDNTPLVEF